MSLSVIDIRMSYGLLCSSAVATQSNSDSFNCLDWL